MLYKDNIDKYLLFNIWSTTTTVLLIREAIQKKYYQDSDTVPKGSGVAHFHYKQDLVFCVKPHLKQKLGPCQFSKPQVQKLCFLPRKIVFHWSSFMNFIMDLQKMLSLKFFLGLIKFWFRKNFLFWKKFWVKKIVGPKKIWGVQKFVVWKKCLMEKMLS